MVSQLKNKQGGGCIQQHKWHAGRYGVKEIRYFAFVHLKTAKLNLKIENHQEESTKETERSPPRSSSEAAV
jgi:hypothetical protein